MAGHAVFLTGFGASTAIGRDAWSSAAAVRAGVSGFRQHPYIEDSVGEPVRAAAAPWLDAGVSGAARFQALLLPAIEQAIAPIDRWRGARLALEIGLPAPRAGVSVDLARELTRAVVERFGPRFASTSVFPRGHAAALLALDAAAAGITRGQFDACVVAAVDSYVEAETFAWLEECDQLHRAGPLNNAWGFIPGEAAGAALLAGERLVSENRADVLAVLHRVGVGAEANRIKTETVCLGQGLTQAFRAALQPLPEGHLVTDVYCDMNGEPYRADEYAFACLRTKQAFAAASDFVAPADCWGDVGAAGGVLHLQLAAIAGRKGYANGPLALIWASSEGGERAAALVGVG